MKKISLILSILFVAFAFSACENEGDLVTIKATPGAPALNNLSASAYVLDMDKAAETFQAFTWTEATYGFAASITYTLQVDVEGKNFATAVDAITVNNALTASISVGGLNKILLDKELEPGTVAKLEFRIKSVINKNVAPVYSNVLKVSVTPYATTFPPIYMCGAATGGWDWTKGVEVRSTAPNYYETIAYFIGGETFRFFKQANWGPTSYNFPYFTGGSVSNSFENASDGDQNFKFLGTTGYYKITCNLKTKAVTMTAVDEPKMFMTGEGTGGWNWNDGVYVKMTWKSDGIWEASTTFYQDKAFRFFAQADWGPTSYNYPYFSKGTVTPLLVNAEDGDKNFKFVGTTGVYKITLNMLTNTIAMVQTK